MITNISIVVTTFNSEKSIRYTLNSLQKFREVIIYDTGSTDSTLEIIRQYSNTNLVQGYFSNFGETKNRAISYASNSWVLVLDHDEYLNCDLVSEIANLELDSNIGYAIKRDNYILGKKMRWGGVGNDWLVRLFNRDRYRFANLPVHEYVEIDKKNIRKLQNSFSHIAVSDVSQILEKIARYSKMAPKKRYPLSLILLKSLFAFLKSYIFQLGFLEGWRGLLIAVSNFNGRFYRYIRSKHDRDDSKDSH